MDTTLDRFISDSDIHISGTQSAITPPNFISMRNKRKREEDISQEFNNFKEEVRKMISTLMSNQESEFKKNATTLKEILRTNTNIENSVAFLSAQNEEYRKKIEGLEGQIKEDKKYITILEDKIEEVQRDTRKTNFEMKNVPKKNNETKEDLMDMILSLSNNIDCKINKSDIRDIYRIRSKKEGVQNTPIIVETSSTILKTEILKMNQSMAPLSQQCDIEELNQIKTIKKNDLKVVSQNIRSIYSNLDDLQISLSQLKFHIDVLVLTECRLNPLKIIPSLNNYNSFNTKHHLNQNDGVVIYVRNTLLASAKEVILEHASCLQLEINDYIILGIYRSPSNTNANNYINSLSGYLDSIKSHKNIIITGDININLIPKDNESNNESNNRVNYLNMLSMYGLLPGHSLPTRGSNCLDHFILKLEKKNVSPFISVLNTSITDHYMIFLCIAKLHSNHKCPKTKLFVDYDKAIRILMEQNLDTLLYSEDPKLVVKELVKKLTDSLKESSIVMYLPKNKRNIKPWMTSGLLRCIRNRNNMQNRLRADPDNEILKISFKRYRNYCNSLIKKIKRNYDRQQLALSVNNSKVLWSKIKSIANLNKTRTQSLNLLNINPSPVYSVNYVSGYFASVGRKLAEDIMLNAPKTEDPLLFVDSQLSSFVLLDTDLYETENVILNLKSDSAPGWDNIPTKFLKLAIHIVAPIICHLANLCFKVGVFPFILKQSIVTPVFKSGNSEDINNYRPISVLPSIAKVLEKLINSRLTLKRRLIPSPYLCLYKNLKELELEAQHCCYSKIIYTIELSVSKLEITLVRTLN
ncbi:uncharacterized protein LOC120627040 [Pararge aegeria]|uniref:uncharacterized protein LOC120627040 n=1 Tax=Pararge aegeria TaxID=116150 RepID=UPI0019D0BF82|nr:uncharacterized protein LOC120627040 [Pararge aegeria]